MDQPISNIKPQISNTLPNQQPVQQPASPVGSFGKEQAPTPNITPQEVIAPSTPEIILHPEVKSAGVEAVSEMPTVPASAQQAGVTPVKEATPLPTGEPILNLSTSKQTILDALKFHKKVGDSIRWLAALVLRQMQMRDAKEK